jgi:hypothetical protein
VFRRQPPVRSDSAQRVIVYDSGALGVAEVRLGSGGAEPREPGNGWSLGALAGPCGVRSVPMWANPRTGTKGRNPVVPWRYLPVRCSTRMRPPGPTGLWVYRAELLPDLVAIRPSRAKEGQPAIESADLRASLPENRAKITNRRGILPERLLWSRPDPTPLPRRCPVLVPVPISAGPSTRPVPLPVDARFGLRTNKSGIRYADPRTLGARFRTAPLACVAGGCRRPASRVWVPVW